MLVLNNVPFLLKKVPDFFGYQKGLLRLFQQRRIEPKKSQVKAKKLI